MADHYEYWCRFDDGLKGDKLMVFDFLERYIQDSWEKVRIGVDPSESREMFEGAVHFFFEECLAVLGRDGTDFFGIGGKCLGWWRSEMASRRLTFMMDARRRLE